MVGTPKSKKPYADYTAASVASLSDEQCTGKDTLQRNPCGGAAIVGKYNPQVRSASTNRMTSDD
jgi:hypothetical protein